MKFKLNQYVVHIPSGIVYYVWIAYTEPIEKYDLIRVCPKVKYEESFIRGVNPSNLVLWEGSIKK